MSPKIALVLSGALVLVGGFAILAPVLAATPAVGEKQQVSEGAGSEAEDQVQTTAPTFSGDAASSAVPPTSASAGRGSASAVIVTSAAEPSHNNILVLGSVLAAIAALWAGLVVRRRRQAGRGEPHLGRRATGATSITSKNRSS